MTGHRIVDIESGGQLSCPTRMLSNRHNYLVGLWVRTVNGFTSGRPYLDVQYASMSTQIPIEVSDRAWTFQLLKITLAGMHDGDAYNLEMAIVNPSGNNQAKVQIDNLFLCPELGIFSASVFEAPFYLETATLGLGGDLKRKVYDTFQKGILILFLKHQLQRHE